MIEISQILLIISNYQAIIILYLYLAVFYSMFSVDILIDLSEISILSTMKLLLTHFLCLCVLAF